MRIDRLSGLRDRLKKGSFQFGALKDGVSSLEEAEQSEPVQQLSTPGDSATAPIPATAPVEFADVVDPPFTEEPVVNIEVISESSMEIAAQLVEETPTLEEIFILPEDLIIEEPVSDEIPVEVTAKIEVEVPNVITGDKPNLFSAPEAITAPQLNSAVQNLAVRMLSETNCFRNAVAEGDMQSAGYHLGHLYQVLDLLNSIDGDGAIGRSTLGASGPPKGKNWPKSAWSMAEFTKSPFSGLLPPNISEADVRKLLYSAWGIQVEQI